MEAGSYNEKVIRVLNAAAAATTDIEATGVDMAGFNAVKFYTLFGAITSSAVTSVKIQQSSDDGSSDAYSDLESSAVTVADDDDNQVVVHDVIRPTKRYVRVVVNRGTANAAVDGIIAVLYRAFERPATNDASTVVAREVLLSPAEGTA